MGAIKTFIIMNKKNFTPVEILRNVCKSLMLSTSIECEVKRTTEYIKLLTQSCNNPDGSFDSDPLVKVISELKDLNSWLQDALSNRVSNLEKMSPKDEK